MCKKTCPTAATLAALQRDLADKDAQLSAAATSANEWKALADERAGSVADLRVEVASLKTGLNKVRGWREKDQEVNAKLVERVTELDTEVATRDGQISTQLEELGARYDRIVELERLAASRLEQLEAREAAHASDRIELVARRDECAKLNDRVIELEGQLAERDERIAEVASRATRRLIDIKGLTKELEELRSHSTKQAEKLGSYLTELEGLRRIIANSNDATALVDASREIERLEGIIAEQRDRLGVVSVLSASRLEEIGGLLKERVELRDEVARLSDQNRELLAERGRLTSEAIDLRRQISDHAAELAEWERAFPPVSGGEAVPGVAAVRMPSISERLHAIADRALEAGDFQVAMDATLQAHNYN